MIRYITPGVIVSPFRAALSKPAEGSSPGGDHSHILVILGASETPFHFLFISGSPNRPKSF